MSEFPFHQSPLTQLSHFSPCQPSTTHLLPPQPKLNSRLKKSHLQIEQQMQKHNSQQNKQFFVVDHNSVSSKSRSKSGKKIEVYSSPKRKDRVEEFRNAVQKEKYEINFLGQGSREQSIGQGYSKISKSGIIERGLSHNNPNYISFSNLNVNQDSQSSPPKQKQSFGYLNKSKDQRNPREEQVYITDSIKNKFNNKNNSQDIKPIQKQYFQKIQNQTKRITELSHNLKAASYQLTKQKQNGRQKQAQKFVLDQRYNNILKVYDQLKSHNHIVERQKSELKNLNEALFLDVEKMRAELIFQRESNRKYEEKNQESLRLLQLLNENIEKREEKLKEELEQQKKYNFKLVQEKQYGSTQIMVLTQKTQQLQKLLYIMEHRQKEKLQKQINSQQYFQSKLSEKQIQHRQLQYQNISLKDKMNGLFQQIQGKRDQYHKIQITFEQNLNRIRSLEQIIWQKERENSSVREELSKLTLAQQSKLKQNGELKLNIQKQELLIVEMTKRVRELEQQISKIKQSFTGQMNIKINQYNNQKNNLQRQHQNFQKQNQSLQVQIKTLNQKILFLTQQLRNLSHNHQLVNSQKSTLQIKNEELNQIISKLNRQIHQIKSVQINLNETIHTRQRDLMIKQEQIGKVIHTSKSLEQRLTNYELHIKQLNNKLTEKEKYIYQLENKLKNHQKLLQMYKEQISQLKMNRENQWHDMKNMYENQIKTLEAKIKQLMQNNFKIIETTNITTQSRINQKSSRRMQNWSGLENSRQIEKNDF